MRRKSVAKRHAATIGVSTAVVLLLLGAAALLVLVSILRTHCVSGQPVLLGRAVVCAEVARTPESWQHGLSERQSLAPGSGMLFVFSDRNSRTFWMKGMRFPLDMVWISDTHVVGFETNVLADGGARLIQIPPVDSVLEINAGDVQRLGVHVGDRVQW